MSRHSLATMFLFFFLSDNSMTHLFAQSQCDPALPGIKESGLGYRDRGDRCEGLYINPVSNTTLFVASFTEQFENFDNTGNTVLIEWDHPPANKEIQLRAQGIKPRLYYRMDASSSGSNSFFAWPAGVITSLNIKRNDIGITGKIKLPIGKTERLVYLPLRIRKQGESKKTGSYKLILLPGVQLTEIYISLSPVGPDGIAEKFIRTDEALGYGYYPAERPVEIAIVAPKNKGIYYVKLGAKIKSGGTKAIEFWFYNPGNSQ